MTTLDRPDFTLVPVVETWEATVYQVTGSRIAYLVVPRASAPGFVDAINTGQIDDTITDYLHTPDAGRTLDQHSLMLTLGLYDRLGDPRDLAAPERDPLTGHSGQARSREDKNNNQQSPSATPPTAAPVTVASRTRWPILAGVGITVVALAGIGITVAGGLSGETPNTAASAPAPSAPATPAPPSAAPVTPPVAGDPSGQYTGTLVESGEATLGGPRSLDGQVEVSCQSDRCTLSGLVTELPMTLERQGSSLVGEVAAGDFCADGFSAEAGESIIVTFSDDGGTMTIVKRREPASVSCEDGTQRITYELIQEFNGTRATA